MTVYLLTILFTAVFGGIANNTRIVRTKDNGQEEYCTENVFMLLFLQYGLLYLRVEELVLELIPADMYITLIILYRVICHWQSFHQINGIGFLDIWSIFAVRYLMEIGFVFKL